VIRSVLKATPKPVIEEEKKTVAPEVTLARAPQEWSSFRFPGMPEIKRQPVEETK
jgi:hypothetical protein